MKTAEYKTATGETADQLDASVNQLIKEGYQPYGVPYYAGSQSQDNPPIFCQALVKVSELIQQKPKFEAGNG
jgi:hypothetical protein